MAVPWLALLTACGGGSSASGLEPGSAGNGDSAGNGASVGGSLSFSGAAQAASGSGSAVAINGGSAGVGQGAAGAIGGGLSFAGESGVSAGGASAGGASAGGASAGGASAGGAGAGGGMTGLPSRTRVLESLRRANAYFVAKWPDPGKAIDSSHPSHIWTRAVYYEGLMGLYGVDPKPSDLSYAVAWGTSHSWGLNTGVTTRNADNQCAGQTYLDLHAIDPQPARLVNIKANIDRVVAGAAVNDWTWVDAIQMGMPVFAKLGVLTGQASYFNKMYAMYASSKNSQGASGFYSEVDHLWWRDADFDPPYSEPNGKGCYWSRGNGWVFAALTRVLDTIPESEAHRAEYLTDFVAMAEALRKVQRADGFWNVSLHDPTHFGGPELSGTSLFAYGMAWGVRKAVLPAATYRPVIERAWTAMASSVHSSGFLGYVQGTGKQPSDAQPVTFDKVPDYEDFGLGCFLLGGSEIARLAPP